MAIDVRSEYVTSVRDPIWTEIGLTDSEFKIIDTMVFNRLRHIRQMGFAYLAFPGANHTRYEHSIGTLRVAYVMYQMFKKIPSDVTITSILSLRLAALLHDIGHPPFSHAVEEVFIKYPTLLEFNHHKGPYINKLKSILNNTNSYSHESFTEYVINNNDEITKILKETNLNISIIAALASGNLFDNPFNTLLNGDFDVDKIDYVIRDSYYCGLSHKIDLNEFRRKLLLEKNQQSQKYELFVTPEGVSAINSLLLARYKLVREAHDNEKNRTATQMFIEKIRLWLEEKSAEERAKTIIDIHLNMTDHDLVGFLKSFKKGPNIDNILNGKLYRQVLSFRFSQMHPVVKASTHIILNNPVYIGKIQDQLREDFDVDNLLFDIQEPKPPKLTTLVRFADGSRNIFSRYYTAHGVLVDSFNDLEAHVYREGKENPLSTKKVFNEAYFQGLDSSLSTIAHQIIQNAKTIRKNKKNNNIIIDIDFLMLVLSTIEKFGKQEIKIREMWVNTDTSLQRFLQKIDRFCKQKDISIESQFTWDNQGFSTKVFRDLERLINMGLVDHIHKLVPYPSELNHHTSEWYFKIDRRISGWGKTYAGSELRNYYRQIQDYVFNSLMENKEKHHDIIELEKKVEKIDELNIIPKREPLNKRINAIRSELKKNNDVSLTIG